MRKQLSIKNMAMSFGHTDYSFSEDKNTLNEVAVSLYSISYKKLNDGGFGINPPNVRYRDPPNQFQA
ncbi:hypothetical protein D3C77_363400 [compost metagenome]